MADDVAVIFSAQIGQLISGVEEVKRAIQSIANPVNALGESFLKVGEGIAAAFAIDKIEDFFHHFADLGTQTQRNAALLGVATDQISGLDIAAKASGGSLEGMVTSMERLGLALARAGGGSEQAKAGLRALGIEVKSFQALSPQQQLEALADRFSVLKDGIDKDAIAMAVLGRSGASMIPIFNQGSAALHEFQEMAERTGSALSAETAEAFDKTGLRLIELKKSFEGIGISIASTFKPAFDGIVKVMTDVVQSMNNSIREGGAFKALFEALAVAAKGLATALVIAIGAIETLWEVGKAAAFALGAMFRDLGTIIYSAFTLDLDGIKAAWQRLLDSNHAIAVNAAQNMATVERNLKAELTAIWNEAADAHVKIEQTKNARLEILNRDAVSARMKEIEGEIKVLQQGLEQKKILLDAEANQHQITQDRKFSALQAETEKEYQAELALLEREKAIGGLNLAQRQEIENKIAQLHAKHNTDMLKLDEQSIAAQQKLWDNYLGTITSAFNSQLRGLLTGTVTWGQAFKNILLDLTIKFIEFIEKMVVEWAAGQLAQTTATTTGAAARTAAELGAQTATLPARAGKFVSDITADAAEVFAGIFANMAPLLGPAAAGPAAAGQATVLAELANVPKFDVGTPYVPRDMLANIHKGEMIVPAGPAQAFRDAFRGGAGGGGNLNVTWEVSAMDGPSVAAFFKQNIRALATQLGEHLTSNPSVRARFAY